MLNFSERELVELVLLDCYQRSMRPTNVLQYSHAKTRHGKLITSKDLISRCKFFLVSDLCHPITQCFPQ